MNDRNLGARGEAPDPELHSTDQLIGRLIDGEAGAEDESRFREMASAEPYLWQTLAERQQDMFELTRQFEDEVASALLVELPDPDSETRTGDGSPVGHVGPTGRSRMLAVLGWAAALILAFGWGLTALTPDPVNQRRVIDDGVHQRLTPDEYLRLYLDAPNVLGELSQIVLEVQEMTDGRLAVRYLRRIEEVAIVDADEDVPVDEKGRLTVDPEILRDTVSPPRRSD